MAMALLLPPTLSSFLARCGPDPSSIPCPLLLRRGQRGAGAPAGPSRRQMRCAPCHPRVAWRRDWRNRSLEAQMRDALDGLPALANAEPWLIDRGRFLE